MSGIANEVIWRGRLEGRNGWFNAAILRGGSGRFQAHPDYRIVDTSAVDAVCVSEHEIRGGSFLGALAEAAQKGGV